ncbi:MAG TPA: hypothetical protein VL981_07880 [Candidatus Methylacidiphilales bacterium]|nr:hypothetical protein [Candidatus Methylacidiphilales bacterium]
MPAFLHRFLPFQLAALLAAMPAGPSAFADDNSVSTTPPAAAPPKAAPATPPKAPAKLDVVTFNMYSSDENHKMVITLGPVLVRLDAIEDRYSVIYDPRGEDYIGLEHSNDTYWQFSWPDVKAKVVQSKRYADHLRDLISQGIDTDDLTSGSTPPPPAADTDSSVAAPAPSAGNDADTSGYTWTQTNEHKRIGGFDCIHWTGTSISNPNVDVWCYAGAIPSVRAAMEKIRAMNEPMALVPVRQLVPAFLFTVYGSLVKGGGTPLLILWGGNQDKNKFSFAKAEMRDNKPEIFAIPKLYIKTTLITMDGITNPVGGGR